MPHVELREVLQGTNCSVFLNLHPVLEGCRMPYMVSQPSESFLRNAIMRSRSNHELAPDVDNVTR